MANNEHEAEKSHYLWYNKKKDGGIIAMLITSANAMMGTVFDDTNEMAMRLNIGDCLTFGSFVPSFDSSDVPVRLPMLWHVIDKQCGSRLKLLSDFFFERTGYWPLHGNSSAVTWKETYIRHDLNSKYYNNCFSEREREAILTTEVKTKTYDSSIITTNDKLFLPALEDIENIPEHLKIGRGVYANCFDDDIPSVELLYCFYWLRDPGEAEDENLVVQGYADSKLVIDSLDHNADEVGVRAVMFIDAEKI